MPYKITWTYTVNTYGFSETFYDPNSTTFAQVTVKALDYLRARLLFSGRQTYASFIRISGLTNPRTVIVVNPETIPGFNTQGQIAKGLAADEEDPEQGTDYQDVALLVRFNNAGVGRSKLLYLRGIPDAIVGAGGKYFPIARFTTPFTAWMTLVAASNWAWPGQTAQLPPPAPVLTSVIATVASAVPALSPLTITTVANLWTAPQVGTRIAVTLKRMQGAKNLNGTWPAIVQSLNSVQMTKVVPIVGFQFGTGTLTIKQSTLIIANGGSIQRVVERKAGKPSFQSAGRKPIRKYT